MVAQYSEHTIGIGCAVRRKDLLSVLQLIALLPNSYLPMRKVRDEMKYTDTHSDTVGDFFLNFLIRVRISGLSPVQ